MANCKQCTKEIIIDSIGSHILDFLKFPMPQICDTCAMRQLMSFRNERTFYPRKCDKCGKNMIAMYPVDSPYTIYCRECWWGDSWPARNASLGLPDSVRRGSAGEAGGDGTIFGLNYSGSVDFFAQMKELQKKVPREALVNLNSDNCDYSNHIRDSKNCYMCSLIADKSEDCYYCYWCTASKDTADGYYTRDCEKSYFCTATIKCFGCSYLLESENCTECHFCYDCKNCENCMLSSNLRNKSYVFDNKQLTKSEYENKVNGIDLKSYEATKELYEKWQNVIKNAIHVFSNQTNGEQCTGDNIQNSVNAHKAYNSFNDENVYNAASVLCSKSILNGFAVGTQPSEWAVNVAVVKGGNLIIGCFNTVHSSNVYFSENLVSCDECIGCIGLQKKKFCILNKQYSEEEYKKIKQELIDYWKQNGTISLALPKDLSTFAYNETAAQDFYPLTKEQALVSGYSWKDDMPGTFGKETLQPKEIADSIVNVNDDITKKVLRCVRCNKNYKIIDAELLLYKKLGVPVPRECFDCRLRKRLDLMGTRQLQNMQCTCTLEHEEHRRAQCPNTFTTKYKVGDAKKIFCKDCYKKEIY